MILFTLQAILCISIAYSYFQLPLQLTKQNLGEHSWVDLVRWSIHISVCHAVVHACGTKNISKLKKSVILSTHGHNEI